LLDATSFSTLLLEEHYYARENTPPNPGGDTPALHSAEGLRLDILGQKVHCLYVEVNRFIN
jgi:hypothetical protein